MMKITWNRFALATLITMVFVNEFVVYWLQSTRWLKFPAASKGEDVVVLFVSDPQLQGYEDEPMFPLGTITRWDSDRYLQKNFELAFTFTDPDVVVYLGDLFDEGSKATAADYTTYFSRFKQIFSLARSKTNIYLPGDNDIGGEGFDMRSTEKIQRFEKYFSPVVEVVNHQFISFLKLDIYSSKISKKLEQVKDMAIKSSLRIVLGHDSVLLKRKQTLFPLFKQVQPRLIFSGHWHESVHWVCDKCMEGVASDDVWPVTRDEVDGLVTVDMSDQKRLHEIQVPTCSYRMGVQEMGYGVAQISSSGTVTYGVLWTPKRYPLLAVYAIITCFLLLGYVFRFLIYRLCFVRRHILYR